jgi:hypothetical protein
MPKITAQQRVDEVAAGLVGDATKEKKPKPTRRKRKPVVCEAAFVESESTWDYLEETYDLLQELKAIPSK